MPAQANVSRLACTRPQRLCPCERRRHGDTHQKGLLLHDSFALLEPALLLLLRRHVGVIGHPPSGGGPQCRRARARGAPCSSLTLPTWPSSSFSREEDFSRETFGFCRKFHFFPRKSSPFSGRFNNARPGCDWPACGCDARLATQTVGAVSVMCGVACEREGIGAQFR